MSLVAKADRDFIKSLIVDREEFCRIRDSVSKTPLDNLKLIVNSFGNNRRNYLYTKEHSDIKYELSRLIINKYNLFTNFKQTTEYLNAVEKYGKPLERLLGLERLNQIERLQRVDGLEDIAFNSYDYVDYSDVNGGIIYLDPPYENTTNEYRVNVGNYKAFYKWCHNMAEKNIVIISGYKMPDSFECVYGFKKARSTYRGGYSGDHEKLFMPRN